MNSRIARGLALLCALGYAAGARAEEAVPLTFSAAVDVALGQRTEMKIAQGQTASARAKSNESVGAFLPTFDLYSDVRRITNYDQFTGLNIAATVSGLPVTASVTRTIPPYQASTGAELGLNLFAGGLNSARLTEARAQERAALAQESISRRETIWDVASAYWSLKRAQIEQSLAAEARALAQEDERIATAQLQEGRISQLERDSASLRALESQARLIGATATLKEQWRRYELALGLTPQAHRPDHNPPLIDDPEKLDLSGLMRYLDVPRPTRAKARADVDSALARENVQRADFFPKVDLFMRYNEIGRDNDDLNNAVSNLSRQDRTVGMRLQWNLFNGLQSTYRLERAQADSQVARIRVEQENANRLRELSDRQARVDTLISDVALAQKRRDIASLEARIARTQREARQISEQQYQSKEFAAKDAAGRVQMTKIDFALAQLLLYLAEARGDLGANTGNGSADATGR